MGAVSKNMRVYHRYLGFFLAGIMAIYSISGVILIFRNTDFLKKKKHKIEKIASNLNEEAIGKAIKIKNLKIKKQAGDIIYFAEGTYNVRTGLADYTVKELPFIISKMNKRPFGFNFSFGGEAQYQYYVKSNSIGWKRTK
jgi:acid phosphatase class B